MKKLRFILSIWACKVLIAAGKLGGKKGSSTPGVYALKIDPDVLRTLSKKFKKAIIATCGTNGKTTTNNLICSILEKKGFSVVCNRVGANMLPGVVTAFIESTSWLGNLKADYAAIEMDEASASIIFKHFVPDLVVLTNLFRDQLDRYGEIDLTVNYLKKALDIGKESKVLVNGDDPICAMIGKDHTGETFTYGISEDAHIHFNEIREGQFCSYCGEHLAYEYYHYSQLGKYACPGCGFARENPQYSAVNLNTTHGLEFDIENKLRIQVDYRGFYNIYNILAAYGAVDLLGIDLSDINEILAQYQPQIGRMERFLLNKPVILNLSKNPAGFNQGIHTVLTDPRTKDVVVMINDNAQDGIDISWIWDVEFERLSQEEVKNIGFCGLRGLEMALRFKYTDVAKGNKVYSDLKSAVKELCQTDSEVLYLLVNYTAIFDAQKILKEMEAEHKGGKV